MPDTAPTFDAPNPFIFSLTAQDGDIDAQGHVNNAVYVRWMDEASTAHSEAVGYDAAAYRALGAHFVVRRHEIDYLAPVLAGEQIMAATWPTQMQHFTAWRHHQIIRVKDAVTVARALTKWIFVDIRTGRPRRMPQELIEAFQG